MPHTHTTMDGHSFQYIGTAVGYRRPAFRQHAAWPASKWPVTASFEGTSIYVPACAPYVPAWLMNPCMRICCPCFSPQPRQLRRRASKHCCRLAKRWRIQCTRLSAGGQGSMVHRWRCTWHDPLALFVYVAWLCVTLGGGSSSSIPADAYSGHL